MFLLAASAAASGSVPVALDMLQRMTDERGTTEDSCNGVGTTNTWDNVTETCWKDASWQAVAVAGIAAALDFNNRDGTFAPQLSQLDGCDKYFDFKLVDSGSYAPRAALELASSLLAERPPQALVGPARSAVSETVAVLAGHVDIPQISYWSTSSALDDTAVYKRFMRTIPTDEARAHALCEFLAVGMGFRYVSIIYDAFESWAAAYQENLVEGCYQYNVSVSSFGYETGATDSIVTAVELLQQSGVQATALAAGTFADMTQIFSTAAALGMNNAGSTQWWVWADPSAVIAALPSIGYFQELWQRAFVGSLYVHSVGGETADNPRWVDFASGFAQRNVSVIHVPADWRPPLCLSHSHARSRPACAVWSAGLQRAPWRVASRRRLL